MYHKSICTTEFADDIVQGGICDIFALLIYISIQGVLKVFSSLGVLMNQPCVCSCFLNNKLL